jgi:hypothetical protein
MPTIPFRIGIIFTRWLPKKIIGVSLGFFVLIDRRYAHDEPTIVHELIHCQQFWRGGLLVHFLRYWLSSSYRQSSEVEAFRAELALVSQETYAARLLANAESLATAYRLKLSVAEAILLLDL